jgi:hypothetical protein
MLSSEEMLEVPSVVDARLPADIVSRLPAQTPPAPWHSNIETALWSFRATAESTQGLGPGLAVGAPFGAAAFISYLDGAVGAYHEILATPRCVRVPGHRGFLGHVPFIAVDSIPSIHGGRTNWALPKLYADFAGEPASDPLLSGEGADWTVRAEVRQIGPWFPFRAGGACAQPWPDGGVRIFESRFRGRARLASIVVEVTGPPSLTGVLPSGRHLGVVIRGSVDVGAPVAA